jgi:subtilase family serine protease
MTVNVAAPGTGGVGRNPLAKVESEGMSQTYRSTFAALATGVVAVATVAVTVPAAAAPAPHALGAGTTSSLPSVTPRAVGSLVRVGNVASSTPIRFSVLVRAASDAALPGLANAVSDPASPTFRHFLTKQQVRGTLDPATVTTNAVETGLRAIGATVRRVSSDGRLIDATASAGALTSGLGVHFAYVRTPDGGSARAALNQPVLPAALRPLVADIVGLTATPVHIDSTPVGVSTKPAPAYFNGRPCSRYYGEKTAIKQPRYRNKSQPYTICGYGPRTIRDAYRVPQTGLTGKGARIAIVDDYDSPTIVADTNEFSRLHGVPPLAAGQFVDHTDPAAKNTPETTVNDPTGLLGSVPAESPQEWSGEQTLDVEMVHAMAPQAEIDYYGGDQGLGLQPLEAEFSQVIADDEVQFISNSWGVYEQYPLLTPADSNLMETELQLGAIEGIGAAFSSGDDGDNVESNDVRAADFPSSSDMATSVGGTTLVVGPNTSYVGETYWGTRLEPETANGKAWDPTPQSGGFGPATGPGSLAGAGGGGVSSLFAEPSWQKGIVPGSLTTQHYKTPDGTTNDVSTPGRVTPDISLVADSTTGVLVGQTQTDANGRAAYSEFRIGGTSVSCPLFAGLVALAIQRNGGNSLGFVSPALYTAYQKSPQGFRNPRLGRNLVNVRTDYKDTQNPHSGVVFHLRLLGQLSTLHDLSGYDDSTGLGTPCSTVLIPAIDKPTARVSKGPGCPS